MTMTKLCNIYHAQLSHSSLASPVLQTMCSRMEAAVNGLQSAVSSVCQQYSWLGHAHSLIAQCKRDKTDNMTAHSFEVSSVHIFVA